MGLTIEDGTGVNFANTYSTITEADEILKK